MLAGGDQAGILHCELTIGLLHAPEGELAEQRGFLDGSEE